MQDRCANIRNNAPEGRTHRAANSAASVPDIRPQPAALRGALTSLARSRSPEAACASPSCRDRAGNFRCARRPGRKPGTSTKVTIGMSVIGFGRIAGRTVGFVANQPMVLAGVLNSDASRKAARFVRFCNAFGVIPQISVIMGPCAGGDVYSPAMTDFIFMVRDTSYMFVTGPEVVKTVTNEVVTAEELGGASVHATKSAVADGAFENDLDCLLQMRQFIDFLPAHSGAGVPEWPTFDNVERAEHSLDTLIPENPNKPYDIKELILKVVDEGDFFELSVSFARNIVDEGCHELTANTMGSIVIKLPLPPANLPNSVGAGRPVRGKLSHRVPRLLQDRRCRLP